MADLTVAYSVVTRAANSVAQMVVQLVARLAGPLADLSAVKLAGQRGLLSVMSWAVQRVVHWAEKTVVYSVAQRVGPTEFHWADYWAVLKAPQWVAQMGASLESTKAGKMGPHLVVSTAEDSAAQLAVRWVARSAVNSADKWAGKLAEQTDIS